MTQQQDDLFFGFEDEEPTASETPQAVEAYDEPLDEPPTTTESVAVASPLPPDDGVVIEVVTDASPASEPIFRGQQFLGEMFSADELGQIRAERTFQRVDLDLETQYGCPRCGYRWSGNPKPPRAEVDSALES